MPIYAYRCTSCGHAKDVLQKVSDPLLTACPACGAQSFVKQVTAAGFQLKGSGWYATDFRGNGTADKKPAGEGGAAQPAGEGAAQPAAAPAASPAAADKPAASPAPAPTPAAGG